MSKIYTESNFDLSKLDLTKWKTVIVAEFKDAGKAAEEYAKRNAPVNVGKHGGTHRMLINGSGGMEGERVYMRLAAGAKYAAYLEFGTGQFAASYVSTLPVELQEYAMTFFKSGKGRLPARPHLVPAFQQAVAELKEHLKAYND